jgi:hypothetical protein
MSQKVIIFAPQFKQYSAIRRFKDNIPFRLAEMQHTWGVFSFMNLPILIS